MEKIEIKFCLNYGNDLRDLNDIETDFEDSIYDYHTCFSFKMLLDDDEVSPSEILKMNLNDIKRKKYFFKARNFNCSNLKKGDYGILKETSDKGKKYYLIKIIEVDDLANFKFLSDKNIVDYINSNIVNKKNYVAKYINFYTDKDYCLNDNNFISDTFSFKDFKNKYKNVPSTLFYPKESIIIDWDNK